MSVEQLPIRHGNEAVHWHRPHDEEFTMIRTRTTGVILAAVCAFVASSLWYSPVLFGRQFLELSGVVAASKPIVSKIAGEMVRNLLLASSILWILTRQKLTNLRSL